MGCEEVKCERCDRKSAIDVFVEETANARSIKFCDREVWG
jgi:hypothetical protein